MQIGKPLFRRKLGSKPLGIWIAWVALLYNLILNVWRFDVDSFLGLPILFLAMILLMMRRIAACVFAGMSLILMLRSAVTHTMPFGILLAIFGFLGILANRKWFDEHLPPAG